MVHVEPPWASMFGACGTSSGITQPPTAKLSCPVEITCLPERGQVPQGVEGIEHLYRESVIRLHVTWPSPFVYQ